MYKLKLGTIAILLTAPALWAYSGNATAAAPPVTATETAASAPSAPMVAAQEDVRPPERSAEELERRVNRDGQLFLTSLVRKGDVDPNGGRVDYVILEVRNHLDRAISVDLTSRKHYSVKVNDTDSVQIKIAPGTYNIAVSAGALKPVKDAISVEVNGHYAIGVDQQKSRD